MSEIFDIPVVYKGKEMNFKAELLIYAYSYKIQVEINEVLVMFEYDDEINLRAAVEPSQKNADKTEKELVKIIALAIQQILK